jgi:multidrug efflux pump
VFARFFIDRPIFATVISVVITLAGAVAYTWLPVAQYPEVTPPTVQVTALYPGANCTVVRDTVAAPIESQVSGVEGMLYMSSQCTNDGAYNLMITFKMGMDSDMAQVLVQNRVSLALPVIPQLVQNEGITVKKMSPNTLMIVNLVSPNKQWGSLFLSNYATINIKDELGRVEGVAGITYLGQRDYSLRVWLDPDRLAALGMSATDVVTAIAQQNVQVAAGQIGQPPADAKAQKFQLTINTKGRLTDPKEFADIILKTSGQATANAGLTGQATSIVRVRDVVRENRYTLRLRFDPSRLADHGLTVPDVKTALLSARSRAAPRTKLQADEVFEALKSRPISFAPDDASPAPAGAPPPVWLATYSGRSENPPEPEEVAATLLDLGSAKVRLGDLLVPDNGVEYLPERDEPGVQLGSQQYDQSCTLDGMPSVALSIYQLPGTNALDVASKIKRKMKELKKRFPPGIDAKIVYDTTPFIDESVKDVRNTLLIAFVLVAIVVLLFLQDWRAMILPMIDVPVSLVGTFAIMAAMGFTLNNLTLFGLVLAIGIVVDDAIVVLENIERQIATGLDARTATVKAMDEITGPIFAITLVLSAVFIPCCFLGGITGQFFRQFAVTIAVSTVISAINAVTMTPSRAAVIFKTEETHDGHHFQREALPWWIFGFFGLITVVYGPSLVSVPLGLPAAVTAEEDRDKLGWRYLFAVQRDNMREAQQSVLKTANWVVHTVLPMRHQECTSENVDEPDIVVPEQVSDRIGYWGIHFLFFLPGLAFGLVIGWMLARPMNAGLGWFFRLFNRAFDWATALYGQVVGFVLRLSVFVCIVYGGLLALTGVLFYVTPDGFIPQQDKGYLIINVQMPDAASVDRMEKVMAKIEKVVRGDKSNPERYPGVKGVAHTIGVSGQSLIFNANAPNLGSMYVILNRFDRREECTLEDGIDRSADAIAKNLEDACNKELKIALVSVFGGPPVDGLGTTGGFKLIVEDRDNRGLEFLQERTNQIVRDENALPGLVNSSRASTPWLYLDIDRVKAETLGLSVSDIFNTLQIYLGSFYVNNFNEFGRTWQVNVQADQSFRNKIGDIPQLQVRNKQGQMILLRTVLKVNDAPGPAMLMRYNMYSAASITGNAPSGTSSGKAIERMEDLTRDILKNEMNMEWTELTYLQQDAGNKAMYAFLLAVMFVFLVLAAQYESWSLPLAVILVVPMCLLSSVASVLFASLYVPSIDVHEMNLFTKIGFVVLVGLASKNAILIVEFAKQRCEQGIDAREATLEASKLRLRPILMTSFAFILGVVPLVIATGAGAEMRRSLGLAVFAGMLGVTIFGIFLTPVFFYTIHWFTGNAPRHAPDAADTKIEPH